MTVSVLSRLAEIFVQSSLLIAVVFLLRAAYGERLDKRLRYYLWLPVSLRLLMPFSVGSRFSVMNLFPAPARIGASGTAMLSGASALNGGPVPGAVQTARQTISASFPWETAALCVWLTGAAAVGALTLYCNSRFYGRLKKDRKKADPESMADLCAQMKIKRVPAVYISDKTASPCAVGIFRPEIYLPSWAVYDSGQLCYILMHELTHIKRRDNLLSLLWSACCAAYWFDPLVWLMSFSARRDRELACDAWVTGGMDPSEKTAYGMALVSAVRMQSGRYARVCAASFAPRNNEMLDRIRSIKNGGPSAKWPALFVCAVLACSFAAFGTSAKTAASEGFRENMPDMDGVGTAVSQFAPDAGSDSVPTGSPRLLGMVKRCDEETCSHLKENYVYGTGWMEIIPPTADGSDNGTYGGEYVYSNTYKVIETTGVGRRVYIISNNDLMKIEDRLYAHFQ